MSTFPSGRAGLSMVEIAIVIGLIGLAAAQGLQILSMSSRSQSDSVSALGLSEQARTVLERITYAVMGAAPDSLGPDPGSAWDTPQLRYQINLGLQDGELVWSDPEDIGPFGDTGGLAWRQRPDAADEYRVIWTNAVRPFLEGELPNGLDDNGNGLVDESGISFTIDGDLVTVRLTLESPRAGQTPLLSTIEARVVCRN